MKNIILLSSLLLLSHIGLAFTETNRPIVNPCDNTTIYTITGGGNYCSGNSGVSVSLSGSRTGVNYQLKKNGAASGQPSKSGTGGALTWTNITATGAYTIVASIIFNVDDVCQKDMAGSVNVTAVNSPTIYSVIGGGCSGASISISGSQSGVSYQLKRNGVNVGSAWAGNGSSHSFGAQTAAGNYKVLAMSAASCFSVYMSGSKNIDTDTQAGSISSASTRCGSGTVNFQSTGTVVGTILRWRYRYKNGSGSYTGWTVFQETDNQTSVNLALNQWTGGTRTYQIRKDVDNGSCATKYSYRTVTVNFIPTGYSVTGGGEYCTGGQGVSVGLSGSQSGVSYQLMKGSSVVSTKTGDGGSIDFGNQTTSTSSTYTVKATNPSGSCIKTMSGNATVTRNNINNYSVAGGGSYCSGGSGKSVSLNSSQTGITYHLEKNGGSSGQASKGGTGGVLTWNNLTASGTYTVYATKVINVDDLCRVNMSGSTSVSVINPPSVYSVTGGGCSGSSISISDSETGVSYQLKRNGANVGSAWPGDENSHSFGSQTTAGNYTVVATRTGCSPVTMSGSKNIDATTNAGTISSSASRCGSGSVNFQSTGTVVGTILKWRYRYKNGSGNYTGWTIFQETDNQTSVNLTLNQWTGGTRKYQIRKDVDNGACTTKYAYKTVTVDFIPTTYTVTGGGSYCAGGAGVSIGLSGSQSGVNYQLKNGSSVVSTIAGTGNAINFGDQSPSSGTTTYTVNAINSNNTGCTKPMTGSKGVTVISPPTIFSVTGGGCSGSSINISDSETGVSYQLKRNGTNVGSPWIGNGNLHSFGSQTTAGNYTVVATRTGCSPVTMSGSKNIDATTNAGTISSSASRCGSGSVNFQSTGTVVGTILKWRYRYKNGSGSYTGWTVFQETDNQTSVNLTLNQWTGGIRTYQIRKDVDNGACTTKYAYKTVTVDFIPTTYTVTGGGSYCAGGAGVSIGLTGSQSGVNYQLKNGSSVVSTIAGTGNAINFGDQSPSSGTTTYTVNAINNNNIGCTKPMTGSKAVTVISPPTIFSVTGGGCSGSSISISGSQTGVSYQLKRNGATVESAWPGDGNSHSFGAQTIAGNYTVIATRTGCASVAMTGSKNIDSTTNAGTISSSASRCGSGSVNFQSTGTVVGTILKWRYRYKNGSGSYTGWTVFQETDNQTSVNLTLNQWTGGTRTYQIRKDVDNGACATKYAYRTVTVNFIPTAYSVTGGGEYCTGGQGVSVGLSGSQSGVGYELMNSSTVVSTKTGTGSAIDFGIQNSSGSTTYTVKATNNNGGCLSTMSGNATVVFNNIKNFYSLTGGGSYCDGSNGPFVTLTGSETGVTYHLERDGNPSGQASKNGTNGALTWNNLTTAGTYTVYATKIINVDDACRVDMTGSSASVSVIYPPAFFNVQGGGCASEPISIDGSETGVSYQLRRNGANVGSAWSGDGNSHSFGPQTEAGNYTVVATRTGCVTVTMTGSKKIDANTQAGSINSISSQCGSGSVNFQSTGTVVGTILKWRYRYKNGSGNYTGWTIFQETDNQTSVNLTLNQWTGGSRTYQIRKDVENGACATKYVYKTVTVDFIPVAYNVTGGGEYCTGGQGVSVGLSGSQLGVSYKLMNGATVVDTEIGTGESIDFGYQTTPLRTIFTVKATNQIGGCSTITMNGNAIVDYNSVKDFFSVSGGGSYCNGDNGTSVALSGSEVGITYHLEINSSASEQSAKAGTGGVLTWNNLTTAGNYTIYGTRIINIDDACRVDMTGSANVNTDPVPTANAGIDQTAFLDHSLSISGSPVGGNWSGVGITGNTFHALDAGLGNHILTYSYTNEFGCSDSDNLTISVLAIPTISANGPTALQVGENVGLFVNAGYHAYQWKLDGQIISGATSNSYLATELGDYSVEVWISASHSSTTNNLLVSRVYGDDDHNFIITTTLKTAVQDESKISDNTSKVNRNIVYYDGFGRGIQTVAWQVSPESKDLVQPIRYDDFGRVTQNFLPFESATGDGLYKENSTKFLDGYVGSAQYNFYQTAPRVAHDTMPFAETTFDNSPLNRTLEQYGAGQAWKDNLKSVKFGYEVNTVMDSVRVWNIANDLPQSSTIYPLGELRKKITIDEEGNTIEEYADKLGQTILKKVETGDPIMPWAQTYYVYDNLNNLRFVMPPMMVQEMSEGANYTPSTDILNRWAFQYKYDERNRMIEKKVPGAGWVYMIYDDRDRLVLTQDANQREVKHWTFTKYDYLNRPILTGIYTHSSAVSQSMMQAALSLDWNQMAGVIENGDVIEKTTSDGWGNSGASTSFIIEEHQDGMIEAEVLETDKARMFGLSQTDSNDSYTTIDYALYTNQFGFFQIYESGSFIGSFGSYTSGDIFRVERIGSTIFYKKNGSIFYTSSVSSTSELLVDAAIYHLGGTIKLVKPDMFESSSSEAGNIHGYTNTSFPNVSDTSAYHTVTYYDDYSYQDDPETIWGVDFEYSDPSLTHSINGNTYNSESIENTSVKGQITGSKVKNLADNSWLKTATYYDNKYRVIQTRGDNNIGGININSSLYDFVGKALQTKTTHGDGINNTDILRTFNYDHADRLLSINHSINGEEEVIIVQNEYNAIGELVDKKLHSTDGTNAIQSVDYRYNIRGWLTSINQASLGNNGIVNDDNNDFFGMMLNYETSNVNLQIDGAWNGNISSIKWSDLVNDENVLRRAYSYDYDALNRLTGARHLEKKSASPWVSTNDFKVSNIVYDLNGNIKELTRNNEDGIALDNLTYEYTDGNQLANVADDGIDSEGFKDGVDLEIEYQYDANGNMVKDFNKGIDSIYYNHLNLPMKVDMGGGNRIEYAYDAAGIKLQQKVYEQNSLIKTTDYSGEFIYENGTLQFVQHEEGRIIPPALTTHSIWEYQYHLKDHLGNTRLTFTSEDIEVSCEATLEDVNYEEENKLFFNIDNRVEYPYTPEADKAAALNSGAPIGPGISLQVNPGDKVDINVKAFYQDDTGFGSPLGVATLQSAVTSAFGGLNGGSEGQQLIYDVFNINAAVANFLNTATTSDTHPAAYLNYLVFDINYHLMSDQSGFVRVDEANNVEQTINLSDLVINQEGYIYIYLSNESNSTNFVYFDDLIVSVTEDSKILETQDYYPFGLTFNQYEKKGMIGQNFKYTGKEKINDLNLNWHDYGARMYDAALGRWNHIDPLANQYDMHSPYHYALNNPIRYIDPDGMQVEGVTKKDTEKVHEDLNTIFADKKFDSFRNLITRSGKKGKGKTFNKIGADALSGALEGLEGDDLALANLVAGAINSEDVHKVEFAQSDGVLSSEGQEAIGSQLPSYINVDATVERFGGLPTSIVTSMGGSGITTATENGTHSVIVEDGDHNGDRSVTTGHEVIGHGRSLGLGRKDSQHVDAVRTENLILRVMGMGNKQRDGTNHGDRSKLKNPKALPNFK